MSGISKENILINPNILNETLGYKPSEIEILIWQKIRQQILEGNKYFPEEENEKIKIYSCSVEFEDSQRQSSDLARKAILENIQNGYNVSGLSANFYLNEPANSKSRKLVKDAIKGINETIELLSVPVIYADAVFLSNDYDSNFVILSAFCEKMTGLEKYEENEIENSILAFVFNNKDFSNENNSSITNLLKYKILKEVILELENNGFSCLYNADSFASVIANFFICSNFTGSFDLNPINKLIYSQNSYETLLNSAENGFLLKYPGSKERKINAIISKWNMAKCVIDEIIPNEQAKLVLDRKQTLIFKLENLSNYEENQKSASVNSISKNSNKRSRHCERSEAILTNTSDAEDCHASLAMTNEVFRDALKINLKNIHKGSTNIELLPEIISNHEVTLKFIMRSNVASKRWFKNQLEQFAGGNNLNLNFRTDIPLILDNNSEAIGFAIQTNLEFYKSNIKEGLIRNFLEVMRKLAAVNAKPSEINICFLVNPETFTTELQKIALELSAYAAKELSLQINTNFSFQKGFKLKELPFLPIVSMKGIIHDQKHIYEYKFKNKGDLIFLLGKTSESFSIEYLQEIYKEGKSVMEELSILEELKTIQIIYKLIEKKFVKTVHNVSSNGLLVSLIEACVPDRFGFDITTDAEIRTDVFLYSNSAGRFIISVSPEKVDDFIDFMAGNQFSFTTFGHVTKEELRVDDISYGFINDVRKIYLKSLEQKFNNN